MEGIASPNVKESQLEKRRFYAGVISFCSVIFLFGCLLGFVYFKYDSCKGDDCKKQSDILKIVAVIPTILGAVTSSGLMVWIKLYFDEREDQLKRETIKERHELERAIPSEYRYSAEMDFLSIYYLKNNDVPDTSYEDFCQKIRGFCDSRGGIREKTQRYIEQHHRETIEEVLKGIEDGLLKGKNGAIPFSVLAKEACNHALGLKHIEKFEDWAEPFYKDIKLYLGAWLYSSIRYGFAIPIHPFVLPLRESDEEVGTDHRSLGKEATNHYHGVNSYIKAIEYIREKALSDEAILPFFPTPESRHMVDDYLGRLVQLLKDERLEQALPNEDLPYVRESPDLS